MNLIGKIFVVIILLLSVLFMGLAMAVYATHKNWKATVDNQKAQIQTLTTEKQRLQSAYDLNETELQREIDSAEQQVRKLESERVALNSLNEAIQEELGGLKQERREATAAVAATQANNERLAKENTGLQQEIIAAQEAADAAFQKTVAATSELHDASTKLNNMIERNRQLTEQAAGMTTVMRAEGIDPATRPGDVKPSVDGYVSAIRRKAGAETIELTIGSDDGLKRGHTVEVFRTSANPAQSKYLGRAEVLELNGDRAFARILPELKKGRIQEGDRVATRLN